MAKVKIFLEPGETLDQAEADLMKAMQFHSSGDVHSEEEFLDPAMKDIADRMAKLHEDMYKDMLSEINDCIDEEYLK